MRVVNRRATMPEEDRQMAISLYRKGYSISEIELLMCDYSYHQIFNVTAGSTIEEHVCSVCGKKLGYSGSVYIKGHLCEKHRMKILRAFIKIRARKVS